LQRYGLAKAEAAAEAAGFVLRRRSLNKAPFYFSRLLAFERT
jgi:magnesium-protoporphyrin O-methyltransferase